MFRKLIAALLVAITLATGFSLVTSATAGAAPVACPVGDGGWYWHGTKVMQCVDDANNMIVFQYGPGGVYEGVAFNAWIPYNAVTRWVYAGTPNGNTSFIRFCAAGGANFFRIQNYTQGSGWEAEFQWRYPNNPTVYKAGAVNHFRGWAGVQAYGSVGMVGSGCIPGSSLSLDQTQDFFPG